MMILKIILRTLLAVLILLVCALAVPTRLYVRYTDDLFLQVRYLFLKFTIPLNDEEKAEEKSEKEEQTKQPVKEKVTVTEYETSDVRAEKEVRRETAADVRKKTVKDRGKKTREKKVKKENPVLKWIRDLYKKGGVEAVIAAFKKIASLAGNVLKPIFRTFRLKMLDISIIVASDDAADTAVNYGKLCAGVYPALSVILNIVKYDDYNVNIYPDFNKKSLETDISAEISVIPWAAIAGALHAGVRFIVFKIKGEL